MESHGIALQGSPTMARTLWRVAKERGARYGQNALRNVRCSSLNASHQRFPFAMLP